MKNMKKSEKEEMKFVMLCVAIAVVGIILHFTLSPTWMEDVKNLFADKSYTTSAVVYEKTTESDSDTYDYVFCTKDNNLWKVENVDYALRIRQNVTIKFSNDTTNARILDVIYE